MSTSLSSSWKRRVTHFGGVKASRPYLRKRRSLNVGRWTLACAVLAICCSGCSTQSGGSPTPSASPTPTPQAPPSAPIDGERKVTVSDGGGRGQGAPTTGFDLKFEQPLPWFKGDRLTYPRMQITSVLVSEEPAFTVIGHPCEVTLKGDAPIKISEKRKNENQPYKVIVDFDRDNWVPRLGSLEYFENEDVTITEVEVKHGNRVVRTWSCSSSNPCTNIVVTWKRN